MHLRVLSIHLSFVKHGIRHDAASDFRRIYSRGTASERDLEPRDWSKICRKTWHSGTDDGCDLQQAQLGLATATLAYQVRRSETRAGKSTTKTSSISFVNRGSS